MNRKISVFLIIIGTLTYLIQLHTAATINLQENIAKNIIRFHVIANSDSKEDQYLKYEVKNALIKALYPNFKNINSVEEARSIIKSSIPLIEDVASQVIKSHGYSYPVTASLTTNYFPMKVYGDYAFPPGKYEALQVRIGNAQGQNWWCVMFPPLCFVDETYSIVSEDSEKKLEYLLTDDELDFIQTKKIPVKIRFKLLDILKSIISDK